MHVHDSLSNWKAPGLRVLSLCATVKNCLGQAKESGSVFERELALLVALQGASSWKGSSGGTSIRSL